MHEYRQKFSYFFLPDLHSYNVVNWLWIVIIGQCHKCFHDWPRSQLWCHTTERLSLELSTNAFMKLWKNSIKSCNFYKCSNLEDVRGLEKDHHCTYSFWQVPLRARNAERKKETTLTQLHQIPSHLHLLFLDGLETFIKKSRSWIFFYTESRPKNLNDPTQMQSFSKLTTTLTLRVNSFCISPRL